MRINRQRNISLFNLMLTLFSFSAVIVLYINNIITVNALATENNEIQNQIINQITVNNNLLTEIERLSNYENIRKLIADRIDLKPSAVKPKTIIIKDQHFFR